MPEYQHNLSPIQRTKTIIVNWLVFICQNGMHKNNSVQKSIHTEINNDNDYNKLVLFSSE